MKRGGEEGNAAPDAEAEVDEPAIDEEAFDAAVEEVEEPLLRHVRSVVENVATRVRTLLVVVLFAIPGAPLRLRHSHAFAVRQPHILRVSLFVVS